MEREKKKELVETTFPSSLLPPLSLSLSLSPKSGLPGVQGGRNKGPDVLQAAEET